MYRISVLVTRVVRGIVNYSSNKYKPKVKAEI